MAVNRFFKKNHSWPSTPISEPDKLFYTFTACFSENYFHFIPFSSTPLKCLFFCNFPTNNWWLIPIFPVRTTCVILLHLIPQKILGVMLINKLLIVSFSSFLSYFRCLRFKYSLSSLFSNVLATSLCLQDVGLRAMSSLADVERDDVHFDEPCGKQVNDDVQ